MKKIQIVALSAVVAVGSMFTACNSGISPDANLAKDTDSLSYAFGATFYQQQLSRQLAQIGLLKDTANIRMSYTYQASSLKTEEEKAELSKKMKNEIDSVSAANERNLSAFFKGLQEGLVSTDTQDAHAAGQSIGSYLAKQEIPQFVSAIYGDAKADSVFNKKALLAGVLTAMKNDSLAMADPAQFLQDMASAKQKETQKLKDEAGAAILTATKAEGEAFLAENAKKDGVVTLPSGLQYKVLVEGKGAKATTEDQVRCHYHGTLIDGTVFDSSVDRGEPIVFGVTQVIKGWTEALQLMPAGSKWQLFVPSDLAYGDREAGSIKAGSTLIFDVELIEVVK